MGRKKIAIAPIAHPPTRRATFEKRRIGVLKKAMELSILCQSTVSLTIYTATGDVYVYSSEPYENVVTKFQNYRGPYRLLTNEHLEDLTPGKSSSNSVGFEIIKQPKAASSAINATRSPQIVMPSIQSMQPIESSSSNTRSSHSNSNSNTPAPAFFYPSRHPQRRRSAPFSNTNGHGHADNFNYNHRQPMYAQPMYYGSQQRMYGQSQYGRQRQRMASCPNPEQYGASVVMHNDEQTNSSSSSAKHGQTPPYNTEMMVDDLEPNFGVDSALIFDQDTSVTPPNLPSAFQ